MKHDYVNGYVISDLHLFANRSTVDKHFSAICEKAAESDFFVLDGDIFDFRWSNLGSLEQTVDAAVDWLESLCRWHPQCHIFYVMGNHDALKPLARRLDELKERIVNFHWHSSYVRIDTAFFLHGDLPLKAGRVNPYERPLVEDECIKGKWANWAYHVLLLTGFQRLLAFCHRPRWTIRRILSSLREYNPDLIAGVTDIYFGHTHVPFSDYLCEGIFFHNTGAAVKGLKLSMLRVKT